MEDVDLAIVTERKKVIRICGIMISLCYVLESLRCVGHEGATYRVGLNHQPPDLLSVAG